jgi:hypothetical protein
MSQPNHRSQPLHPGRMPRVPSMPPRRENLVGEDSVTLANHLSALLTAAGVPHVLIIQHAPEPAPPTRESPERSYRVHAFAPQAAGLWLRQMAALAGTLPVDDPYWADVLRALAPFAHSYPDGAGEEIV